jgi:hypothetical protein
MCIRRTLELSGKPNRIPLWLAEGHALGISTIFAAIVETPPAAPAEYSL